jgi:hypothetical protein
MGGGWWLTCSRPSRNTFPSRSINGTSILLEGLAGEAASAVCGLAGVEHTAGDAVDALDVGDCRGGEGGDGEEEGGEGLNEVHVCWKEVLLIWECGVV